MEEEWVVTVTAVSQNLRLQVSEDCLNLRLRPPVLRGSYPTKSFQYGCRGNRGTWGGGWCAVLGEVDRE